MKKNKSFILLFSILFLLFTGAKAQDPVSEYEKMINERNKVDWPYLNRFHDENIELGLPSKGEKRVVFMGNSITEGWKDISPSFFTGKPYICRGISGQTTPQMLVRFRADVIALKPKVVVILAGINDIAGNTGPTTLEMIEDNIASMSDLANAHNIKVVLCSVLPAYDFPWNPGVYPSEKIILLNKWIKKFASDNDYLYIDYYTSMVDEKKALKAELTYDGVHPNETGYKLMEKLAEPVIKKALKK